MAQPLSRQQRRQKARIEAKVSRSLQKIKASQDAQMRLVARANEKPTKGETHD